MGFDLDTSSLFTARIAWIVSRFISRKGQRSDPAEGFSQMRCCSDFPICPSKRKGDFAILACARTGSNACFRIAR